MPHIFTSMKNRNCDLIKIILILKILVQFLFNPIIPVPNPEDINPEVKPFLPTIFMSGMRIVTRSSIGFLLSGGRISLDYVK